jgi:hypothetical protein
MYVRSFIYQYVSIGDDTTAESVLDEMTEQVVEIIKN